MPDRGGRLSPLELRTNPRLLEPRSAGPLRRIALECLSAAEARALGSLLRDGIVEATEPQLRGLPAPMGPLLLETVRRARRRPGLIRLPGGALRCGTRTLVMGVLNVTPDSFSDGGSWLDPERAVRHARSMIREGADVIDVGGESTRPGAAPVSPAEERRRVLPVLERLAADGVPLSIDTSKASVAAAAFRAGARILNDVSALRGDPAMARLAARAGVAVLLMHRRGTPRTMQRDPRYGDPVADICRELRGSLAVALRAGIPRDRILVDPGIGFGKKPGHNVEILRRLDELRSLGCAVAVGASRKRFIGHYLGRPVHDRLHGTAATVAAAVLRGADLVRVHDVRAMADVTRMADLLK